MVAVASVPGVPGCSCCIKVSLLTAGMVSAQALTVAEIQPLCPVCARAHWRFAALAARPFVTYFHHALTSLTCNILRQFVLQILSSKIMINLAFNYLLVIRLKTPQR